MEVVRKLNPEIRSRMKDGRSDKKQEMGVALILLMTSFAVVYKNKQRR